MSRRMANRKTTGLITLTAAAALLGGCILVEAKEGELPSAAELGAGECRPAGPHDVAAPGEWICDRGEQGQRAVPRHRIEEDG